MRNLFRKPMMSYILALCVAVLLAGGIFVTMSHRQQSPAIRVVNALQGLYVTTGDLQSSLSNPTNQNPSEAVTEYTEYMNRIQSSCNTIQSYNNSSAIPSNLSGRVTESSNLCKDLLELADYSNDIYAKVVPTLHLSSNVKRYQTLLGIKSSVRKHDLQIIKETNSKLSSVNTSNDFPTAIPKELAELNDIAQASKDFSYKQSLKNFQTRALSERQQYWLTYGSLNQLHNTLKQQIQHYCEDLSNDTGGLKACRT